MTTDTDRARAHLLRRAVTLTAAAEAAELEEIFAEEVHAWSPGMSVGSRAELADELRARDEAFTELVLEIGEVDVVGDRGYVEWVAVVGAAGGGDPGGPAPLSVAGVTVATFAGDRIVGLRQYWDEMGLLEAIGVPEDA